MSDERDRRFGALTQALRLTVGGTGQAAGRLGAAEVLGRAAGAAGAADRRASVVVLIVAGRQAVGMEHWTETREALSVPEAARTSDEQRRVHTLVRRVGSGADAGPSD